MYWLSVLSLLASLALASACKKDQANQPAAGPKVGDKVAAPWGGGKYHGTIQGIKGDAADVLYSDDKQVRPVKLSELTVVQAKSWQVGDKVLAVWSSGRFYPGTVTATKDGNVYTVKWDDGSSPKDVAADLIMAP
jgi:hypothetical protein